MDCYVEYSPPRRIPYKGHLTDAAGPELVLPETFGLTSQAYYAWRVNSITADDVATMNVELVYSNTRPGTAPWAQVALPNACQVTKRVGSVYRTQDQINAVALEDLRPLRDEIAKLQLLASDITDFNYMIAFTAAARVTAQRAGTEARKMLAEIGG
jgi:hypothetical protein